MANEPSPSKDGPARQSGAADGWVRKGPFLAREIRKPGQGRPFLEVRLDRNSALWPKKGNWRILHDHDGLPVLFWREYDRPAETEANAQICWAPRGCFVWPSNQEDEPPLFVSVSYDGKLPTLLHNAAFQSMTILIAIGALLYAALFLDRDPLLLITQAVKPWVYAGAALSFIKLFMNLRTAAFINFLTARLIWSGLIRPAVQIAPWSALDAFAVTPGQKVAIPSERLAIVSRQRIQVRASFRLVAPIAVIMDGSWREIAAQECVRLATLHFLERRPAQLRRLAAQSMDFAGVA
ncbi:MAG: hypothetical protein ACLPIX_21705 [Rhodomicrobium sp.]